MSKTYTGGYRLVSLAFVDLALASTAIAVSGLGDALGVKSRNRVVLTDIVVSGEKKNDLSVQVKKDGNNYVIEDVYGYDLEIVTEGSTLKANPSADHITASEIDSGSATSGQVLTADGNGGASWQNAQGGGTKLYEHNIRVTAGGYSVKIISTIDSNFTELPNRIPFINGIFSTGGSETANRIVVGCSKNYNGSTFGLSISTLKLDDASSGTIFLLPEEFTDTVNEL